MQVINFGDFQKVDLRVGRIIAAERVDGSEKLLKLKVDLGSEIGERQIIAGIGKVYEPESLVNKDIIIVANLEPRNLMGLESQGMLLASDGGEGPVILTTAGFVPPGSKIR